MIDPIADPYFYALAIPAVLLAGIGKGGFGGSIGMLATPMIALATSPVQAAAIMLPILCTMDILGVAAYRLNASWRNLAMMAPGALAGIAVGALTFRYMNDDAIRLFIGGIAVSFALYNWGGKWLGRVAAIASPRLIPAVGWSGLSGFTSFIAHAGGPPVQMYLLPQRLDKALFMGTTVWFFFLVNYAKLAPYAWLGQFSGVNLASSAVLLPLAPIGIWAGVYLNRRVSQEAFYRIIHVLLFVIGLKLLYDGASGLGWI